MLKAIAGFLVALALAPAFAQHNHHHMMMKHGAAKLETHDDPAAQLLTVRLGPLNLPAHSEHMAVTQPGTLFFATPVDGWLLAYHPRLTDEAGSTLPGALLHHVAFWNTRRSDFLCPNNQEHIFGAGGEMNEWQAVPGFGYRVHPGDRIRVTTMFANPTADDHPQTFLEVKMEYRLAANTQLKNVYPAWFDVGQCGDSSYDLKPGVDVTSGTLRLSYSGILLGVGGHMHNYGRQLVLENTRRSESVATLNARVDDQGRLLSIPIAYFLQTGGYRLNKGDALKVTATYDNISGHFLPEGAMGIVVGYFLPDNDAEMWQRLVRAKR